MRLDHDPAGYILAAVAALLAYEVLGGLLWAANRAITMWLAGY